MKGLPLYFGKVCSLHPDVISFLICNTLGSVHILRSVAVAAVVFLLLLKRTTKEPKTRLECYICVDTLIQFSVHGNKHENWNVFCLPVSSHFVRGQNQNQWLGLGSELWSASSRSSQYLARLGPSFAQFCTAPCQHQHCSVQRGSSLLAWPPAILRG